MRCIRTPSLFGYAAAMRDEPRLASFSRVGARSAGQETRVIECGLAGSR
jgi:hypothetical protein